MRELVQGRLVLTATVMGRPVAWARAGTSGRARYTPEPYATWKRKAQATFLQACGRLPMPGAVRLSVEARFNTRGPARRHLAVPDLDNLVKAVMDAGNGILWVDDSQVVEIVAAKWAGGGPAVPWVLVRAEEVPL